MKKKFFLKNWFENQKYEILKQLLQLYPLSDKKSFIDALIKPFTQGDLKIDIGGFIELSDRIIMKDVLENAPISKKTEIHESYIQAKSNFIQSANEVNLKMNNSEEILSLFETYYQELKNNEHSITNLIKKFPPSRTIKKKTLQDIVFVEKESLKLDPIIQSFRLDIPIKDAERAFSRLTHTPENPANSFISEYVARLIEIQEIIQVYDRIMTESGKKQFDSEFYDYRNGLKNKALIYLEAMSKVASPVVVGSANFPTKSNEDNSRVARKRYIEYLSYHEKMRARFERKYIEKFEKTVGKNRD